MQVQKLIFFECTVDWETYVSKRLCLVGLGLTENRQAQFHCP